LKKITTKVFLSFLLLLLVLAGIFFHTVFYSCWLPAWLASQGLKRAAPDARIQTFKYTRRRFDFFKEIEFEDLRVILERGAVLSYGDCRSLTIKVLNPGKIKKELEVACESGRFRMAAFRAQDVDLNLRLSFLENKLQALQGNMKASSLAMGLVQAEEISCFMEGDGTHLHVKDCSAVAYDGDIFGDISLDDLSLLSYNVALRWANLDVRKIRTVNNQFFSKLDGRVDGVLNVIGQKEKIKDLKARLGLQPGGKIKASLLALLLLVNHEHQLGWGFSLGNYLPQSAQKELEELVKIDGEVPVEKAVLELERTATQKLSGGVDLKSKALNLDYNLTVDVNLGLSLEEMFARFLISPRK